VELELDDDQQLFRSTTRRFIEKESPLTAVRELHDAGGGFDPAYWRAGCELGWAAMLVPEADGGGTISGHGLVDLTIVAEEMGRLVAPGPLATVNVVADTLGRRGDARQRAELLGPLTTGECVATWAFSEPSGHWDAASVVLTANRQGDRWVLDGTKAFVADADVAEVFLVTARTGDALTQFLVPRTADGVTVVPRGSLDMVRHFADVVFASVTVSATDVVGNVGGAGDDVERQLQVALVLQNAETVGAVDHVLEFTIDYARDRIAFGRPIASYQALKHRFADLKMWSEACLATAAVSARAVQAEAPNASELASVAKAYIADRAPAIVQDCVQLHGGIGVTWEHDLHLYLRRVAQNAALYGSARDHRERTAALLGM
jgi:alkylation response protein AidB-like acyl-CoA dehydrogenase